MAADFRIRPAGPATAPRADSDLDRVGPLVAETPRADVKRITNEPPENWFIAELIEIAEKAAWMTTAGACR